MSKKSDKELLKEARKQLAAAGGKARAKKLSTARRKEIARKAARARWKGKKKP